MGLFVSGGPHWCSSWAFRCHLYLSEIREGASVLFVRGPAVLSGVCLGVSSGFFRVPWLLLGVRVFVLICPTLEVFPEVHLAVQIILGVRLCFVVLLRVLGGASVFLLILPGQAVASLDCSALAVPHGDLGCRDGRYYRYRYS